MAVRATKTKVEPTYMTFETNFKLTSFTMRLNKCHPYLKRDWKWIIIFIVTHSIFALFFIILMYNILFINIQKKDYEEACRNGTIAIVYYIITLKHLTMSWNQKEIRKILDLIDEDYKVVNRLPNEEQDVMKKYVKKGLVISVQWLLITGGGSALFPGKNVVLLLYYWIIGEPHLVPMFNLEYPAFIENNFDELTLFLVIYVLVIYFGSYATCMYTAFTPLGPIFMMHCCSWLEIMEMRVGKLFDGNLRETEDKLKDIIKHLQHVYSLVELTLISFRVIYECTIRGAIVLLPITFYEITVAAGKGEFPLEFISLIIGGILITGSPCYYSDLLMTKGESFRVAVYSFGWERVPSTRIRNMMRLVLMRALKPCAVRSLFKPICLETYAEVLQQSYAIFNVINSVWS